jgi:hypothetical protein
MPGLSASVGQGSPNRHADVITVQTLLNSNIAALAPIQPLRVDGQCGPKTINAIKEYQRRVLHVANPDGRIDPSGATLRSLSEKPSPVSKVQRPRRYRIRTIAGGGLAVFVGASATTFEVEDIDLKQSVYYTLAGVDFGFGFKAGGAQGPSSWTAFSSSRDLRDFHGYVTLVSVSVAVGGGGGAFTMSFVNGPAAGLTINGIGWGTGLGASLTGTHGWMKLRD